MLERPSYRDHIDPEYRRWGRKHPRSPGIAECLRLIRDREARGTWADIIVNELARNAHDGLAELLEAFRSDARVRHYVMMAIEIAAVPESVPFLADVLREGDPAFVPYAEGLRQIGTAEARAALREQRPG